MPKKKKFEVLEDETIDDCLERMKKEGYCPVKRMEKPVFKKTADGSGEPELFRQTIIFEGVKEQKDERY